MFLDLEIYLATLLFFLCYISLVAIILVGISDTHHNAGYFRPFLCRVYLQLISVGKGKTASDAYFKSFTLNSTVVINHHHCQLGMKNEQLESPLPIRMLALLRANPIWPPVSGFI